MLNIQSISKTFNPGTVNAKQALSGLSLHLNHGDFVTIIGSNGAGKSTLFNAIAGSFYVDDGFIELDGEDITYMPEHKRSLMVGRLFQDPLKGTAPGMTIEENLALAYLRTAKGKSPFSRISKKDKDAFRERLSLLNMGLEDRMTQPVGLLSGGQRQALTLLMATLITPKLLLLDEHTAALDPGTAEKVLELTKNIVAEEKITCLMITHNMKDAIKYGNRLIMMHEGHIIYDALMTRKRETPDRMIERCCKYILLLWTMSFCAHEVWAGPQSIRQLPNLTIHRFAQDKVGYVWIATDNGLCRYNGQFYYYYQNEPEDPASLPGNRVSDIRSDENGTLWIVTSEGVCTYDEIGRAHV